MGGATPRCMDLEAQEVQIWALHGGSLRKTGAGRESGRGDQRSGPAVRSRERADGRLRGKLAGTGTQSRYWLKSESFVVCRVELLLLPKSCHSHQRHCPRRRGWDGWLYYSIVAFCLNVLLGMFPVQYPICTLHFRNNWKMLMYS